MVPRRRELVADEAQAEEDDAHVVAPARLGVGALLPARGLRAHRLGREREAKLDVRLDLARVQGAVEEAELDGLADEEAVYVEGVVAAES